MKYSEEFIIELNKYFKSDEIAYLLKLEQYKLGNIIFDMIRFNLVTDKDISIIQNVDCNSIEFREVQRKIKAQYQGIELYKMWQNECKRINESSSKKHKK